MNLAGNSSVRLQFAPGSCGPNTNVKKILAGLVFDLLAAVFFLLQNPSEAILLIFA